MKRYQQAELAGTRYAALHGNDRTDPLSGEWAGDPTPLSIAQDLGLTEPDDELCDAWERGYFEMTEVKPTIVLKAQYVYDEPELGDSITHNNFDRFTKGGPAILEIPTCQDGDAFPGCACLETANYRTIEREYGEYLVKVRYMNTTTLALVVGTTVPTEFWERLQKFADDYPVWDEEELERVEAEQRRVNWEDFGRRDTAEKLGISEEEVKTPEEYGLFGCGCDGWV